MVALAIQRQAEEQLGTEAIQRVVVVTGVVSKAACMRALRAWVGVLEVVGVCRVIVFLALVLASEMPQC